MTPHKIDVDKKSEGKVTKVVNHSDRKLIKKAFEEAVVKQTRKARGEQK